MSSLVVCMPTSTTNAHFFSVCSSSLSIVRRSHTLRPSRLRLLLSSQHTRHRHHFSFVLVIFLLASLTHAELILATYSFFPIWGTARVTKIFKLGTYWAMQVQLGSLPRPTLGTFPRHRS